MSTTPEESPIETWGATTQDVKDLLPGVNFADPVASSNPLYQQNTTAGISDATLTRFIESVAVQVSAVLRRYTELPETVRPAVYAAARNVVATGAAHYAQAALFPNASDPNNGDAYADRLHERYKEGLAALGAWHDSEAADGAAVTGGGVLYSFPPSPFPDGWPA